jgi:hypothetical protein
MHPDTLSAAILTPSLRPDSIFIDWASSVGESNWAHYSVLSLVGQRNGKDYRLGSLVWMYSTDAQGRLADYGVKPVSQEDLDQFFGALGNWPYGPYMRDKYGGNAQ